MKMKMENNENGKQYSSSEYTITYDYPVPKYHKCVMWYFLWPRQIIFGLAENVLRLRKNRSWPSTRNSRLDGVFLIFTLHCTPGVAIDGVTVLRLVFFSLGHVVHPSYLHLRSRSLTWTLKLAMKTLTD